MYISSYVPTLPTELRTFTLRSLSLPCLTNSYPLNNIHKFNSIPKSNPISNLVPFSTIGPFYIKGFQIHLLILRLNSYLFTQNHVVPHFVAKNLHNMKSYQIYCILELLVKAIVRIFKNPLLIHNIKEPQHFAQFLPQRPNLVHFITYWYFSAYFHNHLQISISRINIIIGLPNNKFNTIYYIL